MEDQIDLELANFALTLAKTTKYIESQEENSKERIAISTQWKLLMRVLQAKAYWNFNERESVLAEPVKQGESIGLVEDSWSWFLMPDSFINIRYIKPLRQSSFTYKFGLGRQQALNANLLYKERKVGVNHYIGFPYEFWRTILRGRRWSIGHGYVNKNTLSWPDLFRIAFAGALADSIYGALDDKPSVNYQDYLAKMARKNLSEAIADNNYLGHYGLPTDQWENYEINGSSSGQQDGPTSNNITPDTYNYGD